MRRFHMKARQAYNGLTGWVAWASDIELSDRANNPIEEPLTQSVWVQLGDDEESVITALKLELEDEFRQPVGFFRTIRFIDDPKHF